MKRVFIKENSFIAKMAAWKLKGHNAAIVLGNTIFIYGVSREKFLANKKWLRHELKHVEQFERYGFFTFLVKYTWHSLFQGYQNCCYECEAREAENDDTLLAKYNWKGKEKAAV